MPTPTLAVVNCSQLVTLAGARRPRCGAELRELAIIEDGAMLLSGDTIERVGTRAEIESMVGGGCEVVDAGGRVCLPGFVDAHTHPVFAGTRADEFERRAAGATYQEIAAAGGGIRATVRRTREATEDELVVASRRFREWFLRGGTTTVEAKSGYGLSVDDELKMLRAIGRLNDEGALRYVPTFLGAHDFPEEYRARREEYVALVVEEMLPRVVGEGLAEFCDVFCEARVFTVEESRRILAAARSRGLGLRVHADQLSLSGGALLAAELKTSTADHLEHTDAAGVAALKAADVQPVLLPGSVYALGSSRYPAAREMIGAGLAVVLATDFNPGSSPTPSMTMVLSLASTQMKMTPAEAITAATVNAAYSLGRGRELGSLEATKRADFVIHDCADYRDLAYFFGVEHALETYVGGRLAFSRRGATKTQHGV
ncbi:MAG: imidazolonepropionase [Acidobacteria bacterium]|nr:imidazolonepropionase [Acidobacteriota bacterium]MCA1643572.1 imidazolonepropionase [Acidobacteriota bacterium]